MKRKSLISFVGAGPGADDLITVRGARLLRHADIIIYAGSLVDKRLVERYAPKSVIYDSSSMTLTEVVTVMMDAVDLGESVVRLHTGDPSVYGAIQEQMDALDRKKIPYQVVPGVTSAFAAAAALKQELTLPEVTQSIIFTRLEGRTPVPEQEQLKNLASIGATMVIYLSVGMIEKVVEELLAGGKYNPNTSVAVVCRASWDDEKVVRGELSEIVSLVKNEGIKRQALIIVGDVLKARELGIKAKSKLYDKEFSHGFRTGGR